MTTAIKTLSLLQDIVRRLDAIEAALDVAGKAHVGIGRACQVLGLNRRQIGYLVDQGKLNCTKGDNNRLIFNMGDLLNYRDNINK